MKNLMQRIYVDILIETVLFEFPLKEINIKIPDWIEELDSEHWLKKEIYGAIIEKIEDVNRIRDVRALSDGMGECGFVQRSYIEGMDLGDGTVKLSYGTSAGAFLSCAW